MECTIDWGGPKGMLFTARTGSGHVAAMDGAPDGGGHNLAPRPMEMGLAGTGGCADYDVVLILKRGRPAVSSEERRGGPGEKTRFTTGARRIIKKKKKRN